MRELERQAVMERTLYTITAQATRGLRSLRLPMTTCLSHSLEASPRAKRLCCTVAGQRIVMIRT